MIKPAALLRLLAFLMFIGSPLAAAEPADPRIFRQVIRKHGEEGVHTYRIPGLATTTKGTLIAVFDARNKGGGDLPADIDVAAMRSADNGQT